MNDHWGQPKTTKQNQHHPVPPRAPEAPETPETPGAIDFFALVESLAIAERNGTNTSKWYGTIYDSTSQERDLSEAYEALGTLTAAQLRHAIHATVSAAKRHLDICPEYEGLSGDPYYFGPALGALRRDAVAELRRNAAKIRQDGEVEGFEEPLSAPAIRALANVYDAHADLGELLWTEDGALFIPVKGITSP